jgi:hypothetical protein
MSYKLAFAGDSRRGWEQLAIPAQEWLIDQLEHLGE